MVLLIVDLFRENSNAFSVPTRIITFYFSQTLFFLVKSFNFCMIITCSQVVSIHTTFDKLDFIWRSKRHEKGKYAKRIPLITLYPSKVKICVIVKCVIIISTLRIWWKFLTSTVSWTLYLQNLHNLAGLWPSLSHTFWHQFSWLQISGPQQHCKN